jgi:hypothetical protein
VDLGEPPDCLRVPRLGDRLHRPVPGRVPAAQGYWRAPVRVHSPERGQAAGDLPVALLAGRIDPPEVTRGLRQVAPHPGARRVDPPLRHELAARGKPTDPAPLVVHIPSARLRGSRLHGGSRHRWASSPLNRGARRRLRSRGARPPHPISTLVFSGGNYPNGPHTSIYEASERDFRVVLVADAVSGLYDRGRWEMTNIGVGLLSTSALLGAIMRADDGMIRP